MYKLNVLLITALIAVSNLTAQKTECSSEKNEVQIADSVAMQNSTHCSITSKSKKITSKMFQNNENIKNKIFVFTKFNTNIKKYRNL